MYYVLIYRHNGHKVARFFRATCDAMRFRSSCIAQYGTTVTDFNCYDSDGERIS